MHGLHYNNCYFRIVVGYLQHYCLVFCRHLIFNVVVDNTVDVFFFVLISEKIFYQVQSLVPPCFLMVFQQIVVIIDVAVGRDMSLPYGLIKFWCFDDLRVNLWVVNSLVYRRVFREPC